MSRISVNPRIAYEPAFPDGMTTHGMTYREYLIAQIATGAIHAKYLHGARAEMLAPQIIEIADRIIKEMEKENA